MNISDVYSGGSFLKEPDLNGKDVTLRIKGSGVHEWEDGTSEIVLSFDGTDKQLGLNKTNANTIAEGYGAETANWVGKQITVHPDRTDYNGKRVPCIRIRPIGAVQIASDVLQATVVAQEDLAAIEPTPKLNNPLGDDQIPF